MSGEFSWDEESDGGAVATAAEGSHDATEDSGWTAPRWNPPEDPGPIWSPDVWPPPSGSMPSSEPIAISLGDRSRRRRLVRKFGKLPRDRRHLASRW
jgi:hypothetical protein